MRCCLLILLVFGGALQAQPQVAPPQAAPSQEAPLDPVVATAGAAAGASDTLGVETTPARSNAAPVVPSIYYPIRRQVDVATKPGGEVVGRLAFGQPVIVWEDVGGYRWVEQGEVRGWVANVLLSNIWLRIDKSDRMLYVYQGGTLLRALPADVSANPEGDKQRQSRLGVQEEYLMPEGTFFVCAKNPESEYYRAFVLNYPTARHAERAHAEGLISAAQRDAIVRAERSFQTPPMGTPLGGMIEIHGHGSGNQRAWTRGCTALRNVHMDLLWEMVHVGTPVLVEP